MTVSLVGAYQDVRTSGTTAGFTETAVAGNLFFGTVRWARLGTCDITCPGETPVVFQTEQNVGQEYSHCSYYIIFATGGAKTITATLSLHGGTGHYGQQYNSTVGFNPANIVFGTAFNMGSSAPITVANAPVGAINSATFTSSVTPVPFPVPPWEEVDLLNESWLSQGMRFTGWTGGDATVQNNNGHPDQARYILSTLQVLQEDSGAPVTNHPHWALGQRVTPV